MYQTGDETSEHTATFESVDDSFAISEDDNVGEDAYTSLKEAEKDWKKRVRY